MQIIQILLSLILIVLVVMQAKGTGLGSAWGNIGSYHSKRGMEKTIFITTIIVSILFVFFALLNAL